MPRPAYIPVPVGSKLNRLTVVNEQGGRDSHQDWCVWVECDCGSLCRLVAAKDFRKGRVKSCGCLKREAQQKQGVLLAARSKRLGSAAQVPDATLRAAGVSASGCPNDRPPNVYEQGRCVRLEKCFVCVPTGRGNMATHITIPQCKWCGWRPKGSR